MKRLVVGVLAHVDSGKTTLSEALLYRAGSIRKLGRVDHRDAFLDTDALEKARGITIFAKQAVLTLPAGTVTGTPLEETQITLLDTPGHVDFSAEAERTLQVLDYAVLVISGTDGIQSHTMTLWRLLERYHVPTFIYVNKMDLPGADKALRLRELRGRFGDGCVDFTPTVPAEERAEALGVCSEPLMEAVLATGTVPQADLITAITRRQVFPCYFGAALRLDGIDDLLNGLQRDTRMPPDVGSFGARIFKIGADESGARMTYLKVTDGVLKVKSNLVSRPDARVEFEEKADQLRVYSGSKYRLVSEAPAGTVCAVLGPTKTYPGQGLGVQPDARQPMLEPVLNYRVELPEGADPHCALLALRTLEDEDPQLHVVWNACIDGQVTFDHVKFGYTPEKTVIRDFSCDVKPGQKVAIVGPTGAGKTTMVKLLMRFYDVNSGAITLDGHNVKDFDRSALREGFGMVLQDTWLFQGTIMENIRYGRLDATDEEVIAAAKAACADHFIRTLPGGYQMELNEDASNVSQGQKQLLTIARAILADNKILILDEATSSVDTRTEQRIQTAMDNLMRGRTSFVIAHRLSTIKDADLILVMRDGDIVEQGTHDDLLAAGGFYADLYNSQFEDVSA